MKKWLVRLTVWLIVVLALAVVGAILFVNTLVKKGVETFGPEMAKVEVKLGGASIFLVTGRGELTGLLIGNPAGFKTPEAIKVGTATISLAPLSVFSKTVRIHSINVQGPEITLEESLKGSNLGSILANLEASSSNQKSGGKNIQIEDFVIQGGKIHLSATPLGGRELTVPLPEIHLRNLGEGSGGITAGQVAQKIFRVLVAHVTKSVGGVGGKVGSGLTDRAKDLGKEAVQGVEKAAKGIGDLFKKK